MAHVQQQILEAVVAALVAADTDAGVRVFLDRLDPLQADELPALLVEEAPSGESSQPYAISGIEERTYDIRVSCVIAHATEYATRARDLGLQVETALAGSARMTLMALAKGGFRLIASRLPTSGEGDQARAAREHTWRITYYVRSDSPGVPA